MWDHPHACGDKLYKASAEIINPGSSPRVWGQATLYLRCSDNARIIPTRVGTRSNTGNYNIPNKDHPHACGDKVHSLIDYRKPQGSSPRVWGQEIYDKLTEMRARIIPTRVGTREVLQLLGLHRRDHPHACGDKACREYLRHHRRGSSPRVWGQGQVWQAAHGLCKDHPHACGDKREIIL